MAEPTPGRRAFGPVVLAGLASAGLAAVAGSQPWARGTASGGLGELSATVEAGKVPAANALALVVLAAWGVLLVTRGARLRRGVAIVAALAALALVATLVTGWSGAPDGVRDAYADLGVAEPDVSRSPWFAVAAVAALLTLATSLLAVRLVPSWPAMGRRYDAPTPRPAVPAPDRPQDLDLWRSIDEGRDPTA